MKTILNSFRSSPVFITAVVILLSVIVAHYFTKNIVYAASGPAFVQVKSATPQTNQTTVKVAYTKSQIAGNTNILAIGWNDTAASIASVSDSAGNSYQVAAPVTRGNALS